MSRSKRETRDNGAPPSARSVWRIVREDKKEELDKLLSQYKVGVVMRPAAKGPSGNTTTLHVAAKCGAKRCIELLTTKKALGVYLDHPDDKGETALLVAVVNAKRDVVKTLLAAGANINARNDDYYGALHLLVLELCKKDKKEERAQLLDVAEELLSNDKLYLEPHANMFGLTHATPLTMATKMQHGGEMPWCSDLQKLCQMLQEKISQIEQEQSPPRFMTAQVVDVISMNVSCDKVKEVLEKGSSEAGEAVHSQLGSYSLLVHAVNTSNTSLVSVLMEYGADPLTDSREIDGVLPLYHAAINGNQEVFKTMIEMMIDMKEERKKNDGGFSLPRHFVSIVESILESDPKKAVVPGGHAACLQFLVQNAGSIDLRKEFSRYTAIRIAALLNKDTNPDFVKTLLQLFQTLPKIDNSNILTIFSPEVLEIIMDSFITLSDDPDSKNDEKDLEMDLEYSFLLPQQGDVQQVNEMETLMNLCSRKKYRQSIKHPLVQTLLDVKWRKAWPLYFINFLIYLVFVLVLIAFGYYLPKEGFQFSCINIVLMVLLGLSWLYMTVREVHQMKSINSLYYVKSIENILDFLLVVTVPVIMIAVPFDVNFTRYLSAGAILVAGFNLLLKAEFIYTLGDLFIFSLKKVLMRYLKIMGIFMILIFAFAISMNLTFQHLPANEPSSGNQTDFDTIWTLLPKIIVMSMGEFGYEDFSVAKKFNPALLVFLLFLFIMVLVFMNVLNGYAVVSTQDVLNDAQLYMLQSRLELVYLMEEYLVSILNCFCPVKLEGMHHQFDWIQVLSSHRRLRVRIRVHHSDLSKSLRVMDDNTDEYQEDDDTDEYQEDDNTDEYQEDDNTDEYQEDDNTDEYQEDDNTEKDQDDDSKYEYPLDKDTIDCLRNHWKQRLLKKQ